MAISALRKGAAGGIGKFILFGFLALAAGGLVFSDVGGFFRGGISNTDIARIGDETISIRAFDRTARRTLSRLGISPEQAYQFGYIKEILSNEIRGRLMAKAAKDYDIAIPKKQVVERIRNLVTPMVPEGENAKDTLEQLLRAQGMSERQLEENVRRDLAVETLQKALQGGFAKTSGVLAADMDAYQNETRAIEYVAFPDKSYKDIPAPTDKQLSMFYEVAKESFAIPETRQAQLMTLNTENLAKTIEISEDEIRSAYDDNIESYELPETRTVEQVIVRTEDEAAKIIEKMKAGTSLKQATSEVTGRSTDYIPPQPVTRDNILEDLKDGVFNAAQGDAIGPVKTALGHHILKLTKIESAHTQTFEEVKEGIRRDLTDYQLGETKYRLAATLDDLLASGLTPEDVRGEIDVKITDLPAVTRYGQDRNGKPVLETFKAEKAQILETLFDLDEGVGSAVFENEDGTMSALFLRSITPKSYKPLETVKEELTARWIEDQRRVGNKKTVMGLFAALQKSPPENLSTFATQQDKKRATLEWIARKEKEEDSSPLTPAALNAIFETPVGNLAVLDLKDGPAIARITGYKIPDAPSKEKLTDTLKALTEPMQNEGLALFINRQSEKYPAMINERLLKQAYGNPPQQ